MSAFIGYADVGVWASNRDRDDFLDWFASTRCVPGDVRWERCKCEGQRYMGAGVELSELIPEGESLGLTGDEYDQAAKTYSPYLAQLLGVIESITRGEWKCGVGSKAASRWAQPGCGAFEGEYQTYTDVDGFTRDARDSPFPGMDPYLTHYWPNVCASLQVYTADYLNRDMPAGLVARTDKPICVDASTKDNVRKRFVVGIHDSKQANRLITVVEFQSPYHQIAPADEENLRCQNSSLVEIDLHIGGSQARVGRAWAWPAVDIISFFLRERLPAIPIPLRQAGEDAELRLQSIIQRCYRMGGFDDIDYQEDADPPLEGHDADWADKLLRKAGKRK